MLAGGSANILGQSALLQPNSTVIVLVPNKTKEDFSPKHGLGQQEKKALLAVEK